MSAPYICGHCEKLIPMGGFGRDEDCNCPPGVRLYSTDEACQLRRDLAAARSTLATLATEIEGLRLRHRIGCDWMWSTKNICTCGASAQNSKIARLVKLARGER